MGTLSGEKFDIVICDPPALRARARMRTLGYEPTAAWLAWGIAGGASGYLSSPPAATMRHRRPGARRSPGDCIERDAKAASVTGGAGPDHPVHLTCRPHNGRPNRFNCWRPGMTTSRANDPRGRPDRFKLGVFSAKRRRADHVASAGTLGRELDERRNDEYADEAGLDLSASGEMARLPGQGQHLPPVLRDADAWRGTGAVTRRIRSFRPCTCLW